MGWLFFDKILRMGVGLLVGVWVARYLGPEQFGLFNYAAAIAAIFTAFSTLGLNNIVVRDLLEKPAEVNEILGTAFALQFIGGWLAFGSSLIVIGMLRPDDYLVMTIVGIFGFAMIFKSTEVVRYWFESKVQSKYIVWVENLIFILVATLKVILILSDASLKAFVYLVLVEAAFVALSFFYVYVQQGNRIRAWKFKFSRAKFLLQDGWPLILSGLAVMLYMRVDQIMLGQLVGDEAVGVYSAAVRISEVWYFVPMAIVASVFPAIIEAKKTSELLYHERLEQLFQLMAALALGAAIFFAFLSETIISLLFGAGYSEAAKILVIHIWGGLFIFSGVASTRWFVLESLQKFIFYRTLAGLVVNVVLNYILIPVYGPTGSAWASVISQAVASVFFNSLNVKTRPLFFMQIRALIGLPFFRIIHDRKR